jgi:hypothetical protein
MFKNIEYKISADSPSMTFDLYLLLVMVTVPHYVLVAATLTVQGTSSRSSVGEVGITSVETHKQVWNKF